MAIAKLMKGWGIGKAAATAAAQKRLNASLTAAAASIATNAPKLKGTDWAAEFAAKNKKESYRVFVMESYNETVKDKDSMTFRVCLRTGLSHTSLGGANLIKMEFVGTELEGTKKYAKVRAKAREMARQWRKEWYGPDEWAEFARDRILEPEKFKDLIEE